MSKHFGVALALMMTLAVAVQAADLKKGFKEGAIQLKSAGPIAFAPEGILLVGDPMQATLFAIDTGDTKGDTAAASHRVENLAGKIADLLGTTEQDVRIADLSINPASGNAYVSVQRGSGPDAGGTILRLEPSGKITPLDLEKVRYAQTEIPNAPESRRARRGDPRMMSITDLDYVDGRVLIAGLSNEEFASKLRAVPFPFEDAGAGRSVEIYHGAHGAFETRSPVRTFAVYKIKDEPHLLAAYTCTPLVKFPISQLKPGGKLRGTTIAELGNRNRPLDMIVYSKGGKDYILLANNARGVMKINTDNIDKIEGITERVGGGGKAGLTYETIENMKGVEQLAKLNDSHAVALVTGPEGKKNLLTVELP